MAYFIKVNNERSEAIELIKLMDSIIQRNTWQIKCVGGESTLNTGNERMFPDVFLYGDSARTQVLQGWEVKMPDIPITDPVFIADAQRKADVLGVNSCCLWNFVHGVLYIKTEDGWEIKKEWYVCATIRTRKDVELYKSDWASVITNILFDLNTFFTSGELLPSKIGEIVTDSIFAQIVKRDKSITAEHIRDCSARNTVIAAHISQWWRSVEKEYQFDELDAYSAYAKYVLINWINKFTFANLIKTSHNPAAAVEKIDESISPSEALAIFSDITSKCDFFNIFEPILYADLLPLSAWMDLTDYNAFLFENGLSQVPQAALQAVLEGSVNQFKRSVSGIFATPPILAKILVRAGISDMTTPTIDPCCGTGTIVKEIIDAKESVVGIDRAFSTTFASDKFSFPLQISNLAMTRASAMNLPCLLFKANVFDLCVGRKIEFTDPQSGNMQTKVLPKWGSVVSNLPFVAFDQEGHEESQHISAVLNRVYQESNIKLSRRSDLYQAVILHLYNLLDENAKVSVITSNSWLGTIAGQQFFRALSFYYSVESIITSGHGKWFANADVITVMLFLKRKAIPGLTDVEHVVHFGLLHVPLTKLSNDDVAQVVDSILLKKELSSHVLTFQHYKMHDIDKLLEKGLSLNSCFYDVSWLPDVENCICPVSGLFNVFRGMKTGHDDIYYLNNPEVVDNVYLGRVFKSAKDTEYLIAKPDTFSFVCDKSLAELSSLGHTKTISWINRYKGQVHQSVPNKDTFWKNLCNNAFSGSQKIRLFTGMNPERRVFFGLLEEPAQINQRAIGFEPLSHTLNLELCHALLNSILGVFYAEATGFPKGLAALDNRAEKVREMQMLDPKKISPKDAQRILKAFEPLKNRKILSTEDEYQQKDRIQFESVVADCYHYTASFERIKQSVLSMQKVRLSVKTTITHKSNVSVKSRTLEAEIFPHAGS